MDAEITSLIVIVGLISSIIPTVLCIILFFKVWQMCNDVNSIRETLEEWLELEHPLVKPGEKEL